MDVVSMHQAKSSLSQLVQRAEAGEEVYIGAYGKAQAKLVPVSASGKSPKRFGVLKGEFWVADDFDAPLSDNVIAGFYK